MFQYWLAIIALQVTCAFSLDCYKCSNVSSTDQCHTTVLCSDNERCFAKTSYDGNTTTYTLGCQSKDECPVTTVSPVSIVCRSLSQTNCTMCCEVDACNKRLCSSDNQQTTQCTDDPKFDCASLSSIFDVCRDISHARLICRQFCGLCDFADGTWSKWSDWGSCDVTCGTGHMARTRTCTNPAPGHGGLDCVGDSLEQKECNFSKCPIHGQWSRWSPWDQCSVTCGVGVQHRYHICNNPSPSQDGNPCTGDTTDEQICFENACIDGGWSEWLQWSSCSATCKTGIESRTRSCDNPTPSALGDGCIGKDHEVELCNSTDCGEPSDCFDILELGISTVSGVYTVKPGMKLIQVYCDMDTDGGGWTVFQHRFNGSVDFYRNFSDYEHGFGDVHGEFWLGLSSIQEMTSHGQTELRLDLEAADGSTAYETFQDFSLLGGQYTLHIGQSSGTAGDRSGLTYNRGQPFSTFDRDNSNKCAVQDHGGWWYNSCAYVNLNGNYATPGTTSSHYMDGGVIYYDFKHSQSLKTCKIMFRRN